MAGKQNELIHVFLFLFSITYTCFVYTCHKNGSRCSNTHASINKINKMCAQHALVIPYPAQGHVIPLMELSHGLVDHGFRITFVNTEFNHDRVLASLGEKIHHSINLVSISDGLAPGDDHNDLGKLCEGSLTVMPRILEEVIDKINGSETDKITWIIADKNMAWALEVGKRMGIRVGAFWPASVALLVTMTSIPKLVDDGILYTDGLPKTSEMFELSPGMPQMDATTFSWNHAGDSKTQKIVFHYITYNNQASKLAEFIICNSFFELEQPSFSYMPSLIPIGPLVTDFEKPVGGFWPENECCIKWLDDQPPNSVVYVAFGSLAILDQKQFHELALGLELTNRPFLWVVRPDLTNGQNEPYPLGFLDRVAGRGMIVDWSPQQKVLAHPSVACFLSHCGWNSTIEGVRNAVPFLCWPYFVDQFLNQRYICDVWRIGLKMEGDDNGMIKSEKIQEKVEQVLRDEGIRERSLKWKETARNSVAAGGTSYKNFNRIVSAMKQA